MAWTSAPFILFFRISMVPWSFNLMSASLTRCLKSAKKLSRLSCCLSSQSSLYASALLFVLVKAVRKACIQSSHRVSLVSSVPLPTLSSRRMVCSSFQESTLGPSM